MTNDELDLLAFRYIADELSDDERETFELRLAEDQAAREAVARAVELSQATLVAFASLNQPSVAPREAAQSSWYTRIVWMTSGAVACLVGLIGYQLVVAPPIDGPSPPNHSTAEVAKLANAWSDAQESLRAASDSTADNEESPAEVASQEGAASTADDMDETPSWMLAAVGVESSDDGDDTERPVVPGNSDH